MPVKRLDLSLPQFGFVVATRAALGAGIGLLAADKLRRSARHRIGLTLLTLGVLTTIPALYILFGRDGALGEEAAPRSRTRRRRLHRKTSGPVAHRVRMATSA